MFIEDSLNLKNPLDPGRVAFHIRLRNGVTDRYAKIETEYLLPNQTHYFFSKAFEVYFFFSA